MNVNSFYRVLMILLKKWLTLSHKMHIISMKSKNASFCTGSVIDVPLVFYHFMKKSIEHTSIFR